MILRPLAILALTAAPLAAAAQSTPPADAMPLSQIVAGLENDPATDLGHFDEVEWDSDGYWEVEYYTSDNREVKMRIDPVSGQPITR